MNQAFVEGLAHHQAGRLAQAEEFYRLSLASDPGHAPSLHYLGILAYQAGRSDSAIDLITHAIIHAPGDFEAYSNRGFIRQQSNILHEAMVDLKRAVILEPRSA